MMLPEPMVYVVDDDPSMRHALADLLASVALASRSFGSVQEFLAFERPTGPCCLVLDVRMPGQSGMDFLARMAGQGIDIPTIVITGHGDIAMGVRAMKEGAVDFLAKPFRDQDLLDGIQQALDRSRVTQEGRRITAALLAGWGALSQGEQQVVTLVAAGQLNKQIAAELGVSEITIKVRRANAMRKLGTRTVPDLVRMLEALRQAGVLA